MAIEMMSSANEKAALLPCFAPIRRPLTWQPDDNLLQLLALSMDQSPWGRPRLTPLTPVHPRIMRAHRCHSKRKTIRLKSLWGGIGRIF